jgi:hypothetical protein
MKRTALFSIAIVTGLVLTAPAAAKDTELSVKPSTRIAVEKRS